MSTQLKIWTAWNTEPRERMIWEDPPLVIHPPTVKIRVYFELRDRHGRLGITMIWQMEAAQDFDEAKMRRQMLASTYWDRHTYVSGEPDLNNITAIDVDDPTGLLQWLCPGQDLKDFFNEQNTKQLHDQPVRLPAPH